MKKFAVLGFCALLTACGGGGGSASSSTTSTPPSSAVLNDAPVKGVCYSASPSGLNGATDATGKYQFQPNDNVSFWIPVNGAACGTTPATSASTTAIALGSVIPGTATGTAAVQTFILSLDTGPQAAQTLQALNHGSTSNMDVSGITLPAAQVTNVNNFLASKGDATVTPSVVTLFTNTQAAATLPAGTTLALPVTSTFEASVSANLATTVATGLGTAPTTITIPANRITFGSSSGSQSVNGGTSVPFNGASFQWYDGAGNSIRKVSPGNLDTQITTANIASSGGNVLCSITQPATYTITGNVLSRNFVLKDGTCTPTGTISDTTTITYADDHGSFFSGSSTIKSGSNTIDRVYSGASIRLTPLTLAMLAGKTFTLEAPGCPNGTTTNTVSADGLTMTNTNCGGEVRTNTALPDVPGIIRSMSTGGTNPDGSVILVGLDGPSVAVGSTLVVLTLNRGLNPDGSHSFPAWGRHKILAVQ